MKCLVYGTYSLQFIQWVLIIKAGFGIFVTNFGNVDVLDRVDTLWLSVPILTAIGTCYLGRLPTF